MPRFVHTRLGILGSPLAVLPGAGTLIQVLRQPLVAGSIAALLVMSALWPGPGRPRQLHGAVRRPT